MTGRVDLEAQKLAVMLIHQLAAIKKMSAVRVGLRRPKETRPIILQPIPNPNGDWYDLTIWDFLRLDVDAAIAKGGTVPDLLRSKRLKRPWPPTWDVEAPDVTTLDDAITALGLMPDQSSQSK